MLNTDGQGFKIKADTENYTLSHLMYMDDIKFYAGTKQGLEQLVQITSKFSTDIKMDFGLEKCKSMQIFMGQLQMEGIRTENDYKVITALSEKETYRYLGVQQTRQTEHAVIKNEIKTKFTSRI